MHLRPPSSNVSLKTAFEQICAEQLALCDRLENIADQLGANPDRLQCVQMANQLGPTMRRAHAFETEELFPELAMLAQNDIGLSKTSLSRSLKQLQLEQDDDICLVGEVVEALLEFGEGPSTISPDAIGYLLRGLFVGLRRHLAYEQEIVRNLAQFH